MAREMTAVPGASEVFWGGLVTYADQAKVRLLGVPEPLLAAHGAVSGQTAMAMVQGLIRIAGTGTGVAVTGVAGPDGGTGEKPVGTVWFGLGATRDGRTDYLSVLHSFSGTRDEIQRQSARWARRLVMVWWDSGMDLDSIRSLTDNNGKPFVEAFQTPFILP